MRMRYATGLIVATLMLAITTSSSAFDYKKYGPFVGTALKVGRGTKGDNVAYRAIIIRLDENADACVAFDGDTMRMAGGWTQGGLKLNGLPFSGGHGQFPSCGGELAFQSQASPGWTKGTALTDPREGDYPPLGPIPKDWAHYEGLYLNGNQVVLSYTVGKAAVLESPALELQGDKKVIARSIQIQGGDGSAVVLCDAPADKSKIVARGQTDDGSDKGAADASVAVIEDTTVGVVGDVADATLVLRDGQLLLQLPAKAQRSVKVLYGQDDQAGFLALLKSSPAPADLTKSTKGGPSHWDDEIKTVGEVSTDDKAAYVIDKITVPYSNPYGSQMRIGGIDFFSDGTTAAVCTWDGEVYIISGIDQELKNLTWKRFATGGHETLGLKIVDDKIYTVADDQITRYHDLNDDGEADFYENFNNDWDLTSGFHAFCFDLHTDPQGNFYFAFGAPVRGGGRSFERIGRHHGSIIKVSKDGSKLERYASGFRAPNGMGVSPNGQVTSGDNEGTFVPRSPINWIKEGSFNGVVDTAANRDELKTTATKTELRGGRPEHLDHSEEPKPLAWLPKNVDNSGGGQVWVTSDRWGPFGGELLHMSYGQSALYLVMKEDHKGQMQGGVVKFPVRFTSSAMRARFNPKDGQLYVSGLRGWQTNAAKMGGVDRVRYTGAKVNMPSGLKVKDGKLEITFSEPLDAETAADPDSYSVEGADIKWTQSYGSGEFNIGQRDIDQKKWKGGWTEMYVEDAKLLADGKTVQLEIEDLQPVHEMKIQFDIKTKDGVQMRSTIWNTIHSVE